MDEQTSLTDTYPHLCVCTSRHLFCPPVYPIACPSDCLPASLSLLCPDKQSAGARASGGAGGTPLRQRARERRRERGTDTEKERTGVRSFMLWGVACESVSFAPVGSFVSSVCLSVWLSVCLAGCRVFRCVLVNLRCPCAICCVMWYAVVCCVVCVYPSGWL